MVEKGMNHGNAWHRHQKMYSYQFSEHLELWCCSRRLVTPDTPVVSLYMKWFWWRMSQVILTLSALSSLSSQSSVSASHSSPGHSWSSTLLELINQSNSFTAETNSDEWNVSQVQSKERIQSSTTTMRFLLQDINHIECYSFFSILTHWQRGKTW